MLVLAIVIVSFFGLMVRGPTRPASGHVTSTTAPLGQVSSTCANPAMPVRGFAPISCASPAGNWGSPPSIVIAHTPPPSRLEVGDLIKGYGPAIVRGDHIIVEYVMGTYSTHRVVQSSWHGSSFMFTVGGGEVVPGWDRAMIGMQAGGRREIIIPPGSGYAEASPSPGISAHDTLVCIVDIFLVD